MHSNTSATAMAISAAAQACGDQTRYFFEPSLMVRALSSLRNSADTRLAADACLLKGGRVQLAVGESGSSPAGQRSQSAG